MKSVEFSKEQISLRTFRCNLPQEFAECNNALYRVTDTDVKGMPDTDEDNYQELLNIMLNLFETRLGGSYTKVMEVCDIERSLFSKFMKSQTKLSKINLTRFAIGLKLSQDEYEEILKYNGTPFDYDCRFDYIAACALRTHDELDDFYGELIKYGCGDVLKKRSRE